MCARPVQPAVLSGASSPARHHSAFNLIHHFGSEGKLDLLQKAAAALKPGGRVVIRDQIVGNVMGQASNALIRLLAWQYYLLADGRVHESDAIKAWLRQTGFRDIRVVNLARLPGNSLVLPLKRKIPHLVKISRRLLCTI